MSSIPQVERQPGCIADNGGHLMAGIHGLAGDLAAGSTGPAEDVGGVSKSGGPDFDGSDAAGLVHVLLPALLR
jgi:hypothetical protein